MAAYLVGSRGNARQALGLGLTVTVSHTIGVLALGLAEPLRGRGHSGRQALPDSQRRVRRDRRRHRHVSAVHAARVRGARSHATAARSRHEHTHDHARAITHRPEGWHEHDGMGHTHMPQQQAMGKRGLFALGLSGGMIPSVSALLVLIGSISIGRPAWGIVLTIAFGIGMAAVLVGIGFGLVYARRLVERIPQARSLDLGRRVPVLSAVVVLLAGALIAGQGLVGLGLWIGLDALIRGRRYANCQRRQTTEPRSARPGRLRDSAWYANSAAKLRVSSWLNSAPDAEVGQTRPGCRPDSRPN